MSVATEIERLQQAKADLKIAIEAKGVTVPSSALIDDYADLVEQISGGGEDYVQSGLIFHLDGSNATTSQWVDKAQGITFNMANVVLANGGVVFNGSSSKGTSSVPLYNASYLCGTIEVVISTNSPSTTQFVLDPGNTFSMAYGLLSGRALCFMSGPGSSTTQNSAIIGSGVFVQTVVKSSLNYINGSPSSFGAADAWSKNNSYITIGCRNNNSSYFNGTIYQIRVYARELTVSEILHNHTIDIAKYNIQ